MQSVEIWRLENAIFFFSLSSYILAALLLWHGVLAKSGSLSYKFGQALVMLGLSASTLTLLLRLVPENSDDFALDVYRLSDNFSFLLVFSWFVVSLHLFQSWRNKMKTGGLFNIPFVVALLIYGMLAVKPDSSDFYLLTVYRSNWLFVYVVTSALAYGSFANSFGLGIKYLLKKYLSNTNSRGRLAQALPNIEQLDELGYKLILHGFVFFSISIIVGGVWAHNVWGTFWSWEPKEIWSLVSWLAFASYLHARMLNNWQGNRSAWMAIMGFLAILFTFFGVGYLLPGQNIFGI